ncbi:hypothetical protein ILYODFUR_017987 [Ilyodon furcidens]|uniref:Uncharacterized protein n=1 Tax=Ilyodon furcidens TaxID=33524 RepID=A0ABV0VHB7_9TELE
MRLCSQLQYYISAIGTTVCPIGQGRPHRVHFIRDHLQNLGVKMMEQLTCSLDLNLTEHLLDHLNHAVRPNATALTDLKQMQVEEFNGSPQQCVTKLVTNMRRSCQAVMIVYDCPMQY